MHKLLCGCTLLAGTVAVHAQQIQGGFDRTLKVAGAVDLDVSTDSGGIVVTRGTSGSVQIHAILKAHKGWTNGDVERRIRALEQNPPIQQNGNMIRIGHVSDPSMLRGVSMRFEISTPSDTRLHAQADSGGIKVSGIHGPVECQSDSGGIDASDIASSVRATVDSGGIHIANVGGNLSARADSGGIDALDVGGAIDASTDSGGIRVSQRRSAPIKITADSGGAHVTLAPSGGYDVLAMSDSGRVIVPEMVVRGSFSKHRVEGKVRGGGPLVDVQVDSGNVTIE